MKLSTRRAHTRDRVIAAAIEVFSERGVQGASVEEIAERAGFTRGAFYSNFDSKVDVCAAILELEAAQATAAALQAVSAFDAGGQADLETLVDNAVAVFVEVMGINANEVLVRSEMRLLAAREPDLRPALRKLDTALDAMFVDLVEGRLAAHGRELALPTAQVLSILRAVYDHDVIDQVRSTGKVDRGRTARTTAAVLRGLIVRD